MSAGFTREEFLELLKARGVPFDDALLKKAEGEGWLKLAQSGAGKGFTRGHMLLLYQLSRHSRVDWFPWDTSLGQTCATFHSRLIERQHYWSWLQQVSASMLAFYDWFWSDDIEAFPAPDAVRLTQMVRRSLLDLDKSGYLSRLAEHHQDWQDAQGPVLMAAELLRLKAEVDRLLKDAAAAGMAVPSPEPLDTSWSEEHRAYLVTPQVPAQAEDYIALLERRSKCILEQDWDGLAELFEEASDYFEGSSELEYQRARLQLYMTDLDKPELAVEAARRLLEIEPLDPSPIPALGELYGRLERWSDWVEVLEQQIALAEEPDVRGTYQLVRAKVLAQDMGESERALTAFSELLNEEQVGEEALDLLQDLVREGGSGAAFEIPAMELIVSKASPEQQSEMGELFELVEGRKLEPKDTASLLHCQANYVERCGNGERAFIHLTRALTNNPISTKILGSLERLSPKLDNLDELVAVLEDEFEKAEGLGVRAVLGERLGRLQDKLGQSEEALRSYEAAIEAQPMRSDLLQRAAVLAEQEEKIEHAIALRRKLSGLVTGEEAKNNEAELERLQGKLERDPATAVRAYAAQLQQNPDNTQAREALVALVLGDSLEVARSAFRVIETVISKSDIPEWARLAEHMVEEEEDSAAKVALLNRLVTALKPLPGQRERALKHYAHLFALRGDSASVAGAKALANKPEFMKLWAEEVDEKLKGASQEQQVKGRKQLARIYADQLHDKEAAERQYREVLAVDASDDDAFQGLRRSYSKTQDWESLIEVYLKRAEAVAEEKIELLMWVGQAFSNQLRDFRAAYLVYDQVLGIDRHHESARRALSALITRTDAPESSLQLLEEIEHKSRGEKWVTARLQRASLLAGQGLVDEAVELLEEAIKRDFAKARALERLESILRREERWEKLQETLKARIAFEDDPKKKHELEEEYARLKAAAEEEEESLDRLEMQLKAATDATQRAELVVKIGGLLLTDDLAGAVERLEAELSQTQDKGSKVIIMEALARIFEEDHNLDAAESALKAILALQSASISAVDKLVSFYQRNELYSKALVLMKYRLAKTPDEKTKVGVLAQVSNVAQRVYDWKTAKEALKELLVLGPRHGINSVKLLKNLISVLLNMGEDEEALVQLDSLCQKLRALGDTKGLNVALQRTLRLKLRLNSHDGAWKLMDEARQLADSVQLRLLSIDLLLAEGRGEDALMQAESMLEDEEVTEDDLTEMLKRLARAYLALEDERAELVYQRLLEMDSEDEEAKAFLAK